MGCADEGNIQLKVIPTSGQDFSGAKRMTFEIAGDGLEKSPQTFTFDFGSASSKIPAFAIDPKAEDPWFDISVSLFDDVGALIGFGRSRLPFVSKSVERGVLVSRVNSFGWLTELSDGSQGLLPRSLVGHRVVALPKTEKRSNDLLLIVGGSVEVRGNRGVYEVTQPDFLQKRLMLFNPSTGIVAFSNANLANPRVFHTATLMSNGKVIIAGGLGFINNKLTALNSVEVYDPETDTVRGGNGMKHARAFHTATRLDDSQIIMVGGVFQPMDPKKRSLPVGQQVLEVENYIVGDSAETSKVSGALLYPSTSDGCGPFPSPDKIEEVDGRFWHQTSRLTGDLLLVTGGLRVDKDGNREVPTHAILLERNGSCWKPKKVERGEVKARFEHTAVVMEVDGRRWAVIVGGRDADNNVVKEHVIWGEDGRPLPNAGTLAEARFGHAAMVLPNQQLLVFGGIGPDQNALRKSELFSLRGGAGGIQLQPVSVIFAKGLEMQEALGRFLPRAALSPDDQRLVLFGGGYRDRVSDPAQDKEKLFTFRGHRSAELFTPKPSETK